MYHITTKVDNGSGLINALGSDQEDCSSVIILS